MQFFRSRRAGLRWPGSLMVSVLLSVLACNPMTAFGESRPNFSGVWTNASLTRLTRPANIDKLVISVEEAEKLAANHFHNVRAAKDLQPSNPHKTAPEKLEKLPPVGNYNAFWVDPGARYGVVDNQIRSSWLTKPESGQIPHNEHALALLAAQRKERGQSAGPEHRSVGERCLLGFGSSGGPPMLNVLYNNFYRFVQTPDHLMMLVEMVHDARIVRFNASPRANSLRTWLGDSVGQFEGTSLVVRTSNFHPERGRVMPLPLSPTAQVEERFQLQDDSELRYSFRIEDPVFYSEVMLGEMTLRRADAKVYEYACHEGNYGLGGILRGARLLERENDLQ